MRSIYIILLFNFSTFLTSGQTRFSKQQVLDDFDFLYRTLEETHYNLYVYNSKDSFDYSYKELCNKVTQDSLDLLETTTLFQKFISIIKNGHTSIEFPIQSYLEYAESGGTLFPLEIAFENNKAKIRKNWSDNQSIVVGSEVISINGLPIERVLDEIHSIVSAERAYLKNAKIELYSFPRYYWQVFGEQNSFKVEIKNNGKNKTVYLDAIKVIEGYETKRDEVIKNEMKLEFIGISAYLNPGGFGGDESKYRSFIDSAFAKINTKNSKNLIIDLRNNPGGDDAFSDYLVSYIADKPFQWNSKFSLKTSKSLKEHIVKNYDTSQDFWKEALAHKNSEVYDYSFDSYIPQPKEKRYNGNVYILVNRQSHSQSAVTAAQIQDYGFGIIVGEETAEYPSLYASIFQFTLPETQIKVNVSKGHIIRVNGSNKEEGVIPDIVIKDHLLDEKDEIINGLLDQITR